MTQPIGNPSHIGNLDASQLGPQPTHHPDRGRFLLIGVTTRRRHTH